MLLRTPRPSTRRRDWSAALAVLSVLILGSYLFYTEHLVRAIRADAAAQTQMYGLVQRGLASPEPGAEAAALWEIQKLVMERRIPLVLTDSAGGVIAAMNLPFPADLSNPEDRRRVLAYAARLDRHNAPLQDPVGGVIHFGPAPIVEWLRWVPWLQVGGALLLLIVSFGVVRAEARAERERMWAAMARELAHQMGTPLSSLAGWVEVLRLPPPQQAALLPAELVAQHIATDLERLERVSRRFELIGKHSPLEPVPLPSVLRELEEYFRPRLPRFGSGIRFHVRVRRGLPPVRASRVLLVWALENLVKNAVDALAGRGGWIRVVALPGGEGKARIYVVDNGLGIEPSLRERIFEPGVSTKSAGWGVGLSLARRIVVQLHGGTISVRPRRGGGTVFEVQLPAWSTATETGATRWKRWLRLPERLVARPAGAG